MRRRLLLVLVIAAFLAAWSAPRPLFAAEDPPAGRAPDAVYVATPYDVVEKMLEMAKVTKDDVVYDLGCGDGRIVVTAARKYGCHGVGFELDDNRIREARQMIQKHNVGNLVTIKKQDIFTVDLSKASVITLYLLPWMNVRLIPQLQKLKPGSRIVCHDYAMQGRFDPEKTVKVMSKEDAVDHSVYLFTTPLKVEPARHKDVEDAEKEALRRAIASHSQEISFSIGKADFVLVRIPPGEFTLGSAEDGPAADRFEKPAKRVRISKAFYLGKFEVTQSQYREVMGAHQSKFRGDLLPVDQVTYSQATEFCRRLSKALGVHVGLPTEAQWEYACRAGTKTRFYSGNDERDLEGVAWFEKNSGGTTHQVGKKRPNAFGLYDMLGNVSEPCADLLPLYGTIADADPRGREYDDYGMMRGGCALMIAKACRAAHRVPTSDRFAGMGIRIAIIPEE